MGLNFYKVTIPTFLLTCLPVYSYLFSCELTVSKVQTKSEEREVAFKFQFELYLESIAALHLSLAILGVIPGTYGAIVQDLLTFVADFWPETRTLYYFCTSEARPMGFVTSPPS